MTAISPPGRQGSCTFLLLIVFIALGQLGVGQSAARLREISEKLALEKGYGILFCVVDSTAVTSMTTDFTGLIDIDIRSDRMDTLLRKKELQTAGGQKALLDLAQLLVKQGVSAREKRRPATAVFC